MPAARFVQALDPEWLSLVPVLLGRVPPGDRTPACYVVVESDSGAPQLRCHLYDSGKDECFAFQEACVWRRWLVVGFGHSLHIVDLDEGTPQTFALGSYFGHIYPLDACLLVASAEHLHRLDPDGSMKWRSAQLGLDGVVVERVLADAVDGQGEWDPPGGWRPFRVSLDSGARR
jgi:hypothetical protein